MSKRPSSGTEGQIPPRPRDDVNVVWWEEARLRQALPRVIGRCMSFSAATCFDDALVAAVRRFYGIEVDVATAETDILEDDFERVRFFPWFLWDFAVKNDGSVGERFAREGELSAFEKRLVEALVASSVAFVEVAGVSPEQGLLVLRDMHWGDDVVVRDQGLASELAPGQVALLRLVRVPEVTLPFDLDLFETDGASAFASFGARGCTYAMVDAIYAVLPHEARALVLAELPSVICHDDLRSMKERAPELLDFAEHVLQTLTAPPTLLNADGEPIVLCRTFIGGDAADELADALEFDVRFAPGSCDRWLWEERGCTIGWLRRMPNGFAVEASSRERLARLCAALEGHGIDSPRLHSEEELARAVAQWLARGESEAWLADPEVEAAFRGRLGDWLHEWPDQPHPALGRRTPREVKSEPGGDAVVARLLQRVQQVAGDAAGAELASLLA